MDNPIIVFLYCHKTQIRITDCVLLYYVDSSYDLLTLSPPSHGLSANILSDILKSPQKFIPTFLLPENQGLIQKSLHVGFVVIVVFKPSKPTITTFPTLVVFIPSRLQLIVRAHWRDKTIVPNPKSRTDCRYNVATFS
jgi:hypothetical protein